MKSVLLFLAGVLVGANVVYFLVRRDCPAPAMAPPALSVAPVTQPVMPPGTSALPPAPAPARTPVASSPGAALPASAIATTPAIAGLLLPVAGIAPRQLTDTFGDDRQGTRRHEALDIMAARGTPVLAASDGKVAKLFTSVRGGLTIYEFDPASTYCYYYAHLDRYANGLVEGQALKRGDVIGYVGSTGDASPDAPHLHFAIFLLGPEKQWWKGTPINPYPLLASASGSR
ncbi:M23 family metallopeptidase [Cognatiluteimonas profundi]|uniref:M23 family metallopeptidase n=1 Tax=Cognatiluteimonas profundi TaxID=2594501 RepID=UPI00131CDCD1|nr:M23 family metallopeptidase [Lysobacter profundi]